VKYAVCCTYGLFALNRPDAVSIDHGLQDIGLQQITCTYVMELFYSANTYTCCSCTGERPTLPNLLTFPVKSGSCINIPRQIGTNYFPFGVLLVNDETGAEVNAITTQYRDNAQQINLEILRMWIGGKGKHRSWGTLINVLKAIGLSNLAGDIQDNLEH